MIKSTALLTIALFFTVAPSPDANILSQITGGFLKEKSSVEVIAGEFNPTLQITQIERKPSFEVAAAF